MDSIAMRITLPPEIEQFVQHQIETVKYASAEDVLLAGTHLLEDVEATYKGRFDELRREIIVGVAEADRGDLLDEETVFQSLREKLQRRWSF
ncbi:MAG: type II toxin-antitoxin system ParD family antitoxin [Cyanobacteria bacterium J06636_16]